MNSLNASYSLSNRNYQQMGQAYCVKLCGENDTLAEDPLKHLLNYEADEPIPEFAKRVKQHIEIHSKVKETYMLYRTPHTPEKKGTKLELHYLFQYSAYYQGEWKSGLPHGFGRIIYDDGSLYEGCFNNGVAECHQALFIRENGSFFRGNIRKNKASGYGELSTNKLFYKGNWVDDLPNGKAKQIYSSISFYEGQFVNGMKEGNGVYQWNNSQYYIGHFHQNRLDGKGDLITKDYSFRGEFREGKKEGDGVYTDNANNFVYRGPFQANQPHGNGQIVYNDGARFEGEFDGFERRKGYLILQAGERLEVNTFEEDNEIQLVQSIAQMANTTQPNISTI